MIDHEDSKESIHLPGGKPKTEREEKAFPGLTEPLHFFRTLPELDAHAPWAC